MQIWNIPFVLQTIPERLTSSSGAEIVLYSASGDTEKANIQFEANAIIILLEGHKEVYNHAEKISLAPGDGFLIKKGNYVMTEKTSAKGHYKSLMIFFDDKSVRELLTGNRKSFPRGANIPNLLKLPQNELILNFAQTIRPCFGNMTIKNKGQEFVTLKIKELFWIISHSEAGEAFLQYLFHLHFQHSSGLVALVETHFKENLSLEQLAFLGGYSLSAFKRKFEEVFQQTPGRWIQERRLKEAHFLLRSTDMNVSEVCFESGFENSSHFIKSFKEKFGLTPKQFRTRQE